jgi:hypothetical protein
MQLPFLSILNALASNTSRYIRRKYGVTMYGYDQDAFVPLEPEGLDRIRALCMGCRFVLSITDFPNPKALLVHPDGHKLCNECVSVPGLSPPTSEHSSSQLSENSQITSSQENDDSFDRIHRLRAGFIHVQDHLRGLLDGLAKEEYGWDQAEKLLRGITSHLEDAVSLMEALKLELIGTDTFRIPEDS